MGSRGRSEALVRSWSHSSRWCLGLTRARCTTWCWRRWRAVAREMCCTGGPWPSGHCPQAPSSIQLWTGRIRRTWHVNALSRGIDGRPSTGRRWSEYRRWSRFTSSRRRCPIAFWSSYTASMFSTRGKTLWRTDFPNCGLHACSTGAVVRSRTSGRVRCWVNNHDRLGI